MFGLANEVIKEIKRILNIEKIEKIVIFGSRAQGNYRRTSDIDIAIFGELTDGEVNQLRHLLAESRIIYKVDLIHYESITNDSFRKSIAAGIEI